MLKKKIKKISTILMLIGLIAAIAAPIALAETHYWHCQICGIRLTQGGPARYPNPGQCLRNNLGPHPWVRDS